jgi:UDP-N-acetyl-D-mannosaminuronic acid dehydrogenase
MFEYDVCIIGTGRVGLPLGLSFLDVGRSVVGFDVDPATREMVNSGQMPFKEPGYDALVARKAFMVHGTPEVVSSARAVVITVGTPLHTHIETDLSQIQKVLTGVLPHLRTGQLICLRSTVAPGTTTFVRKFIERHTELKVGTDVLLAFCPERIAEGKAYEELRTLPQIVGVEDDASREAAIELFSHLAPEVMPTNQYVSAELVKLFNNIARYVHFAVANQFALVADTFGANIYEIRHLANHNYPRSFIAAPGFTAGTCLRKDFGMINEWSPYPDMLLSAWKMNEYIPNFLVKHLGQRTELHDRTVAVLGFTFKKDTDDTRDSLAPKLYRYIQRELPTVVRVTDHHLPPLIEDAQTGPVRNWPVDQALEGADCVFVATNHTGYDAALRRLAEQRPGAWVADLWNVGGIDKVFYRAGELIGVVADDTAEKGTA